ncbi:MAG: AI-2E family transporter [Candidatus Methanoperedens sp.]|nr:AI-2E family transporter [Candidatus Methanoperedens sp.]
MAANEIDGVSILIKNKWKIALFIIILAVFVLFSLILMPLLDGIVLGILLAYICRPLKRYFEKYSPKLSPFIAMIVIVLPIFLIIGLGIIEIFNHIIWAVRNHIIVINALFNVVESLTLPEFIEFKTKDIILNFTSYILPFIRELPVGNIFMSFTLFMINILIAVFLCFFLLIDGPRLVERIVEIIPADIKGFSKRFLWHLDGILSAIFIGNAYSAIAAGILSLIVLSAFGVGNVMSLSALILVAAIVPIFAAYMIIVPLTIYRYLEMGSFSAIVFFIVSVLVIIVPPEILIRPYIISIQSKIHPMLIVIAFVGGGLVGGIAGLFAAPMLLGAIIAAYRTNIEMRGEREQQA